MAIKGGTQEAMKLRLKNISEQVIVITGASSGIGLATARMAAEQGARLVLAARSQDALRQLVDEIRRNGGQAVSVTADISKREGAQQILRVARDSYGGFDTWVNNAGIGMYGRLEETDVESMRNLFDTNFWGVVYGSLEAVKHLKERGGALINVGSTVSDRATPLQGIYAASKHAVKAFTDSLRMELEEEDAPISISLIKPGAIDTPFPINAKNYLRSEPQHAPPVYAPEVVARAILYCAEHPVRDVFAGGGGKYLSVMGHYAPRMMDKLMESFFISATESGRPARPREQNGLDRPSESLQERGNYEGHVAESSLYTQASLHPVLVSAAVVGAGLGLGMLLNAQNGNRSYFSRRRKGWW